MDWKEEIGETIILLLAIPVIFVGVMMAVLAILKSKLKLHRGFSPQVHFIFGPPVPTVDVSLRRKVSSFLHWVTPDKPGFEEPWWAEPN